MGASLSFELLKLRKRAATWVLALVSAAALGLVGYLFTYAFVVNAPEGAGAPSPELAEGFLDLLLPEGVLVNVLSNGFAGFGGAIALILGALAMGGEYGWGTLKTVFAQRPGRLSVFSGKLLALGAVLLVLTVAMLGFGSLASYAVSALEDAPANWPPPADWLRAVGAGWLILATFCALGLFLATLFRGTGLAIGLGLVYLLVLENLFLGLAPQSETVENVGKTLPAKNALDLADSFGKIPQEFAPPAEAVGPTQAALILMAYLVVFLALAALFVRRRDVT